MKLFIRASWQVILASAMVWVSQAQVIGIPGNPEDPEDPEKPTEELQPAELSVEVGEQRWHRIRAGGSSQGVIQLNGSEDLKDWAPVATAHGLPFEFLDPNSGSFPARYYHAVTRALTNDDDWKNIIRYSGEPFLGGDFGQMRFVKFAILLEKPWQVVYQHQGYYPFHYDFAVARLEPFKLMSRAEFDQVSLFRANQQVLLGAVVIPPDPAVKEFGIQFVGLEPYPPEMIAEYFELVRSTVNGEGLTALYMPVYEQSKVAQENKSFFEARGIEVAGPERWALGDVCYSAGWSIGTLKFIPASEIEAAYADGRLGPADILVTDGVPAEVPFVAGIISYAASTPNSHVAILARSYNVPFVFAALESTRASVTEMLGREVILRVRGGGGEFSSCEIKLFLAGDQLEPALREKLIAMKQPPAIDFVPKSAFAGGYTASVDGLRPADIRHFGGKASNFGFLRQAIPESSPKAIAISFNLWDEFMEQTVPSGKSLREEIQARIGGFTYPPDVAALRAELEIIRELIRGTAQFTVAQEQAIIGAINAAGFFDPERKIRFRSSTNLEDSETFTGAGLYDSYSGCLLDETDSDGVGPSHCDATQGKERGIFRAIKRVYASFYNENAFLERLRHGVDESQVGMAILVHHSFPDEEELANGVATLELGDYTRGQLVTQKGALSVANPDGSAQPEVVEFTKFESGTNIFTYFSTRQQSSLLPLGGHVLEWEAEYQQLAELLGSVAAAYQGYVGKERLLLDFEYKKIVPGKLIVKQVREVPLQDESSESSAILIGQQMKLKVFQGADGDVFGNHRAKSLWQLTSKSMELGPDSAGTSFYGDSTVEFVGATGVQSLSGSMNSWPGAFHEGSEEGVVDGWVTGSGEDRRVYRLVTQGVRQTVTGSEPPIQSLSDFEFAFEVQYGSPQPAIDWTGAIQPSTNDFVRLTVEFLPREDDVLQERVFHGANGLVIRTRFYWPKPPQFSGGYTAPLIRWVETTIEGLTVDPIVLDNEFSQTYRPEHHNFDEHFIFEPGLDPDVTAAQVSELEAKQIRLVYVFWTGNRAEIQAMRPDGTFFPLSERPGELK